ncbi:oxygenase MpaB family protein [Actinokineospora fastidiosa]|uniref:Peptidase n=1 Tax=Actinokineospora fastidiosa TaxID=1816 RepID=A0A918LD11_9PSEU|nr:oxygenase MpaB family protein [Actinokineospora fastidiosa]GGS31621.1 peptidase [Actinokineospora fastidiosa]
MRERHVAEISRLDPEVDYLRIYQLTSLYEFPFDVFLALQMSFYRTYAIPSISATLAKSGEITARPIKRGEDTGLMVFEIVAHGFEHERSQKVLRAMNAMHRKWDISQDEFRYVLGVFLVPPMRWLETYGYRKPHPHEYTAAHRFYTELGTRMGITGIPASYAEFAEWFDAYEREHLAPTVDGQALLAASHRLFVNRFPKWLGFLGVTLGNSLLDDVVRDALGVTGPPAPVRAAIRGAFRLRGRLLRRSDARPESAFTPGGVTPGYPDGYTLDRLGPPAK